MVTCGIIRFIHPSAGFFISVKLSRVLTFVLFPLPKITSRQKDPSRNLPVVRKTPPTQKIQIPTYRSAKGWLELVKGTNVPGPLSSDGLVYTYVSGSQSGSLPVA